MTMLRDIALVVNGRLDSTDPRVGVLASEIPTGASLPAFLLNDIDAGFPNRLYSLEILTPPAAGVLYLDKAGAGTFSGAPNGTYGGQQLVEKFDPGIGLVSSDIGTYRLQVGVDSTPVVPVVTGVIITPDSATGTQQFTAAVTGQNNPSQEVTWSKVGAGTLSADGFFTAPGRAAQAQVIAITATSKADPNFSDTVNVVIPALVIIEIPPEVTGVTVSPGGLLLLGGSSRQFSAVVAGTGVVSQEVVWSIDKGSINANGVAVMPDAVNGEQLVEITATSVQNPAKFGKVTVTVQAAGEIDPSAIVLTPARTLRTAADNWKIREGYVGDDGDTFYLSQGFWTIDKDADDILYYALDINPYLGTIDAGIASVAGLPQGVEVLLGPFVRNGLIIVKVGGGNTSMDINAENSLTFRVSCSNGEKFDRTIYFVMKDN